jgi:NitT/TauT family transport system substrate-binding protein
MRRILALAVATSLACIGAAQAQAQTKIRLGLSPTPENASAFVAKDRGYFAKQGLDVDFIIVPINSTMPGAMMAGSMEVGALAASIFLQALDGGIDLQGISSISVTSKTGVRIGILVRDGFEVPNGKALEGKTVGVPALNAPTHILGRRWIIDNGGDYKKVRFVETAFPVMPDALKGGSVDAVVTVDPFLARIVSGGIGKQVADVLATIPDGLPTSLYATTRKYAEANPAVVRGFRAAIDEAAAFIAANPDGTRENIATYIKLPPEVLKVTALPKVETALTLAHLQWWSDMMDKQGMLNGKVVKPDILAK